MITAMFSRQFLLSTTSAFVSAIFLFGCSTTSEPDNPKSQTKKWGLLSGVEDTVVYDHGFLAYIANTSSVAIIDGVVYDGTIPQDQLTSAWVTGNGTVKFDGSSLTWAGSGSSSYQAELSNLRLDGVTQSFVVTGNSDFPGDTLTASIIAPKGIVRLTAPQFKDTVSRSSGMSVVWNDTTGNQDVLIMITPISSTTSAISVETTDTGTYSFSSSALSGLSAGWHNLTIVRGHVATGKAPNNSDWIGLLFTQESLSIYLN